MGRSGSYYDDFQQYGRRGQYDYRRYLPTHRETDEERAARKAQERRAYEERYGRRDEQHDSSRRGDDSHKRKTYDDRGKSHDIGDPSKRARLDEKTASATLEKAAALTSLKIPSKSPALEGADIQTLLGRPSYQVERGPPTLQSRFPHWCLKGVRFDLDLVPIDKEAMLRNLDTVKLDIERMSGWQKLVDELQRVNRANLEAMLTMENDKSEWQKILDQHNTEMKNIAEYNEKLEAEVEKLKHELATSSTSYTQKEEVLQKQVRDAHAAQRYVETRLEATQKTVEKYRADFVELREKANSQDLEIMRLKAQLSKTEKERDEAMAGKKAAEQSHEETKANISSTLFDFYVQSVLGRGSLAFLGPKYEITLAEVWEAVMDMLKGAGYSEDELEAHYFDDETRAALARGKEQLVKVRAETMGGEHPEKEAPLIAPVPPSTSADIDIIGSSSHSPSRLKS